MCFKVGDKVYTINRLYIGTVIRITPKRGDVVVQFKTYTNTYDRNGYLRGCDVWAIDRIEHLTPEVQKKIEDKETVEKCDKTFNNFIKRDCLSPDQARRILEILQEDGL